MGYGAGRETPSRKTAGNRTTGTHTHHIEGGAAQFKRGSCTRMRSVISRSRRQGSSRLPPVGRHLLLRLQLRSSSTRMLTSVSPTNRGNDGSRETDARQRRQLRSSGRSSSSQSGLFAAAAEMTVTAGYRAPVGVLKASSILVSLGGKGRSKTSVCHMYMCRC